MLEHLKPVTPRAIKPLTLVEQNGWRIKRYAILAEGRAFNEPVADAAAKEALFRLPRAGGLGDAVVNHGIALQIIHFTQVAEVSPVFYWQWGSVLASMGQMRAPLHDPTNFGDGVSEVVGCIWELEIIAFEVDLWRKLILSGSGAEEETVQRYLNDHLQQSGL